MSRAESRLITRNRLLVAGRAEFYEHGLYDANLRDILKRANVSAGAFYHHFEDKIDLFLTIAQEAAGVCHRVFADAFATPAIANPTLWVEMMFTNLLAFGRENREILLLLFGEAHNGEPRVRKFFLDDQQAHVRETADNLRKLVPPGIIRPVDFEWAAFLVVRFVTNSLNEQLRNPRSEKDWVHNMTRFVIGGLPSMAIEVHV